MRRFPTYKPEDNDPNSPIQRIMQDAIGPIVSLSADPTTSGNQLPYHGDAGYKGNNLFIRLGATIVKFSGAAV